MSRSRNWEPEFESKKKELGVSAELLGPWKTETPVLIKCKHGERTISLRLFCGSQCCCKRGATSRKRSPCKDRAAVSARLLKHYSILENRAKRGEIQRKAKIPEKQLNAPALLYVAERNGQTKVGRVLESGLKRRGTTLNVEIIDSWELPNFGAQQLELKIHEHFGHRRPLDPSFGPGWTEVFDVPHQELINFIENLL